MEKARKLLDTNPAKKENRKINVKGQWNQSPKAFDDTPSRKLHPLSPAKERLKPATYHRIKINTIRNANPKKKKNRRKAKQRRREINTKIAN